MILVINILKILLKTQEDVSFLLQFEKADLEKLVAVVRNFVDG